MSFHIRKSVRVGPLRFNISTSGIGVSTGIPGFRIGSGPSGTYVHMGRGGLYYRKTLSPSTRPNPARQQSNEAQSESDTGGTHGPMAEIGSGCVSHMVDTNSAALLSEIQQKRNRILIWPFVAVASLLAMIALLAIFNSIWLSIAIALVCCVAVFAMYQYDQLKKSVVLMYDLDGTGLESFQALYLAIGDLANCGAVWHLTAKGEVYNPKYHAGAGALVNRKRLYPVYRDPPYVKTNLPVPSLRFGNKTLYLLPDRILFYSPNGVGAVNYDSLEMSTNTTQFIEDVFVPSDAAVVDHTWRYVNKDGGPDRRFNNNSKIPICEYEELSFSSPSGVQESLQISRLGVANCLVNAINKAVTEIRRAITFAEQVEASVEQDVYSARTLPVQKHDPTDIHLAIFYLLCCMMVADGRASNNERLAITELMNQKAGWSTEICSSRIDLFISKIEKHGHASVVRASLSKIPLIKQSGYANGLLKSMNFIGLSEGEMGDRERRLICKTKEILAAAVGRK